MGTDQEWEKWGSVDPYYGVLTNPKFRSAALTPEARDEFFSSGRAHAHYVLQTCRQRFAPDFWPADVLDFGCGVGRLLIPFAAQAQRAVGLDISPSMLAEARRNCEQFQITNATLALSDDTLSAATGGFDLVHSSIVLQHLDVARGRVLFERLVEQVRPGGIGAIHVTFGWTLHSPTFGQPVAVEPPIAPPPGALSKLRMWLRPRLEGLGLLRPPPPPPPPESENADPEMQMNYYNLSELFFILQRAGVAQVHTDMTDHGGALGAFLFFRRA